MAELIPLEYRLLVARRRQSRSWAFIIGATMILCGSSLLFAFGWKQKRSLECAHLTAEYQSKSVLIAQARELQSRRLDLAARMQKMQQLTDDKVLLSLLRNVSDCFSNADLLSYINIDAHSDQGTSGSPEDYRYKVQIVGVTSNDTSHADLVNRLSDAGARKQPLLSITPESLHREKFFDGQVMRFKILGERPAGS